MDTAIEGLADLLRRRGELRVVLAAAGADLEVVACVDRRTVALHATTTGPGAQARKDRVDDWLAALPGARRSGGGVVLPSPDLRGRRLGVVARRVVERFPRAFEPFYAPRAQGRRELVPESEWDRVRDGLAFRTVELVSDGRALEVDGYRSRVLDPVVTGALQAVLLGGSDADAEALLARLAEPVVAPVHPDAAQLSARLRALAAELDPGRSALEFEPVPVDAADPLGTWLHAPGYLEEGLSWPTCDGDPLPLVFQAARGGPVPLPDGVALLQVFAGPPTPWELGDPSLCVRAWPELHPERAIPAPVRPRVCYRPVVAPDGCLPPFHALEALHPEAEPEVEALCAALSPLDPCEAWEAVEAERVRRPDRWSMVGPVPRWFGEPDPALHGSLVVQLGSSDGLHWGQGGVAYLFHTDAGWRWLVQDG